MYKKTHKTHTQTHNLNVDFLAVQFHLLYLEVHANCRVRIIFKWSSLCITSIKIIIDQMCVCVWERECVCVYERERESVCMRERERVCVCACMYVCIYIFVYVCVCVLRNVFIKHVNTMIKCRCGLIQRTYTHTHTHTMNMNKLLEGRTHHESPKQARLTNSWISD